MTAYLITIYCEADDPEPVGDALSAIKTILPYMTDNVEVKIEEALK